MAPRLALLILWGVLWFPGTSIPVFSRFRPPFPPRRLATVADIHATVQALLLPQWGCRVSGQNTLECQNPERVLGQFVIKTTQNLLPGGGGVKDFTVTVTNSPNAIRAPGALGFHGTYRLRLPASTSNNEMYLKIQGLLGRAGLENSSTLFVDIAKFGFYRLRDVYQRPDVLDLIREVLDRPTTHFSQTALISSGVCLNSGGMPCSLLLSTVSVSQLGATLKVGSRQIFSLFPAFNFGENFPAFKKDLLTRFKEVLAEELKDPILNFEQLRGAVTNGLRSVCGGCDTDRQAASSALPLGIYDLKFDLPSKVPVEENDVTTVRDVTLACRAIVLYVNMGRGRIAQVLFDNPRVQTETLLPLDQKHFESTFQAEAQSFVDFSKADPEVEKQEIILKLDDLKTKFEELKDKCPDGKLTDGPKPTAFFVECGGKRVMSVAETTAVGTFAFRIDFLQQSPLEDGKPRRTSIVLAKVSPVDQFGRVKGELEAYLGGVNVSDAT